MYYKGSCNEYYLHTVRYGLLRIRITLLCVFIISQKVISNRTNSLE
ncbi:unnamed protein product [Brugia timori]|uniref:Uncharacterized protein n=1 Tax=Brugia timori TaxID=42155 RepID=A0A0R3QWW8_9BILA|nr:unnamed protein product [Brugia timori]